MDNASWEELNTHEKHALFPRQQVYTLFFSSERMSVINGKCVPLWFFLTSELLIIVQLGFWNIDVGEDSFSQQSFKAIAENQPFDHSIDLPAGTTARLSNRFSSPYGPAILHGHSQLLLITDYS